MFSFSRMRRHLGYVTRSRHGLVFAAGLARVARGRLSLRLTPLRKLRPGHYTLTLISGAGSHEMIRSEAFTLGPGAGLRCHQRERPQRRRKPAG